MSIGKDVGREQARYDLNGINVRNGLGMIELSHGVLTDANALGQASILGCLQPFGRQFDRFSGTMSVELINVIRVETLERGLERRQVVIDQGSRPTPRAIGRNGKDVLGSEEELLLRCASGLPLKYNKVRANLLFVLTQGGMSTADVARVDVLYPNHGQVNDDSIKTWSLLFGGRRRRQLAT